jgi:hypothetical protein
MKFFDYDLTPHRWTLLQRHVDEIEAVFAERKLPSGFIKNVLEDRLHGVFNWGTDEDLAYLRHLVRFVSTMVPYDILNDVHTNQPDVRGFCDPDARTRFRIDAEGRVVTLNVWTGEETIEE